jgi:phosphopantothenoylcysteine decarboxylase/phosphopantothenate--cysteine ligase
MTGSIAALWAAQYIFELRAGRYVRDVRVVMSQSATQFVTPMAMRAIAGSVVLTGLFDSDTPFPVGHVQVSHDADVLIVMPATANIIAKAAHGIADDAISASILAARCPVVFVPNMNPDMWRHTLVRRNVRMLTEVGYRVVGPARGRSASQLRAGDGAMPPFETIVKAVRAAIRRR